MKKKRGLLLVLALAVAAVLYFGWGIDITQGGIPAETSAAQAALLPRDTEPETETEATVSESGSYTAKEELALYIYTYGHLPDNFVTKKEAQDAGWTGGSLESYLPGMCIGGDKFGNREGLLPKSKGRQYYECDVNTLGASSRGAERIVFSNDGLIYYTADHYESYTLLYGEP